ncbi:DUF1289 domain-containing protein [Methylocapsa sp. S129]|uniref:DUF1289 domain-containing protein n=1 Tax=Methylocapsa sp. S129 TaxID=1641869 RepID=UPI00131BE71C|nr:DUF1289 domain-containing protein [Methylocapsa sp. S129]
MSAPLTHPPSTPCIQVCVVDPRAALCIGCGRTLSEIAAWGGLDEPARLEIMAGLSARLVTMRSRKARGRKLEAQEGS